MCGIVGFITAETVKGASLRRKFLDLALVVDTIRGKDSTGAFVVRRDWDDDRWAEGNKYAEWAKATVPGDKFIHNPKYLGLLEEGIHHFKYAVGHNRAATIGGINVNTAHPFQEGPITLVHNGTLQTTYDLPKPRWEVKAHNDSHTICHNLAIEDPEKVIELLDGAFALVWHDMRDDSLNIARNDERPLHATIDKDDSTIYLASEGEMLRYILREVGIKHGAVASIKPGYWLKFTPDSLMDPTVKKVKLAEPKTWNSYDDWYKSGKSTGKGSFKSRYDTSAQKHSSSKEDDRTTNTRTETTPKSSGVTPPEDRVWDTKVKLLGKYRDIPEIIQDELLDNDYLYDTPLNFIPCKVMDNIGASTSRLTVVGKCRVGRTMVDYMEVRGVPATVCTNYMDRIWSVLPTGILYTEDDKVIVTARYVGAMGIDGKLWFIGHHSMPTPLPRYVTNLPANKGAAEEEEEEAPQKECGCTENEFCKEHALVRGPDGDFISQDEFNKAVQDGCCMCGDPVFPIDAEDVMWTHDGAHVICKGCLDYEAQNGDLQMSSLYYH